MEKSTLAQGILERLLVRTGDWYIIIVTVLAQVAASVTTLISIAFEELNAEYSAEIKTLLNQIGMVTIPITIVVLLIIVFLLTRQIRVQLSHWKQDPEFHVESGRLEAWKSANNLHWKYAISAVIVSLVVIIIPKTVFISYRGLATPDQLIYGLIAGLISILASVPLSTILLDRFLMPVRNILVPKEFSQQLSGLSKLRILYKFLAVVVFSLFIAALLIAPIGYHQTTRALHDEIAPFDVINDLQIQSVLVSGFAIVFAISLTFLITKSISDPLKELLEIFQKVETGDLSKRMPVSSSDEVGRLAIYFNRMVARLQDFQSSLEKMVEERTSQLKAINEVGRVATSTLDPDEIISRVVNLITEEFGYYYSAIYMINHANTWAELKDATGEAGRVLKESTHKLAIDRSNIVGRAIQSRHAQIALDIGEKAVRFDYPLLPYTRSEISLPLFVGEHILGALDVQSTQEAAFSKDDIDVLQNMANQVAILLDNARLFQETNQSLHEMRNIQKQYLREAWIDANLPGGEISLFVGDDIKSNEKHSVEVPIALRDQIIGQLVLEGNEALSPDEQSWVQAIATQAALALENARLLDESQSVAMREKFVTEINNKIWASTTIDGVLQTAIRELGKVLDATDATIELDVDGE